MLKQTREQLIKQLKLMTCESVDRQLTDIKCKLENHRNHPDESKGCFHISSLCKELSNEFCDLLNFIKVVDEKAELIEAETELERLKREQEELLNEIPFDY